MSEWNASAGNRTRVTSMARMYSTTRPLMHNVRLARATCQPVCLPADTDRAKRVLVASRSQGPMAESRMPKPSTQLLNTLSARPRTLCSYLSFVIGPGSLVLGPWFLVPSCLVLSCRVLSWLSIEILCFPAHAPLRSSCGFPFSLLSENFRVVCAHFSRVGW